MRIVDLTHPFDDGMPVFPGLPEPSFRAIAGGDTLDAIPSRVPVVVAPMKLRDSGGAPARILALLPD